VPFESISAMTIEAPQDLRDMVWMPVQLTLSNGGQSVALVPTCYAGTREQGSGAMKLARATEWLEIGENQFAGLGQRVFATSSGDVGLLDVRELLL
jgi:type VI secretion system protein ImpE